MEQFPEKTQKAEEKDSKEPATEVVGFIVNASAFRH
jgi:hypothetical protein